MKNALAMIVALCLTPMALVAENVNDSLISIRAESVGDTDGGEVVVRVRFGYELPSDQGLERPVVVAQGTFLRDGRVLRNFRHQLRPGEHSTFTLVERFTPGPVEADVRLLVPLEGTVPAILARSRSSFDVSLTGTAYVAEESDGAEGIVAEGTAEQVSGSVRIRPPQRATAPHLFLVDVDVTAPVRRVAFFVNGEKIQTKNAPPYRAELDLGTIPRRVEVKAVGYDVRGRYVDADAWIVNERETPLEVRIVRTEGRDGADHVKVSVQSLRGVPLKSVELYAGERLIRRWSAPPYAATITPSDLRGAEFLRATAVNTDGIEATDLVFLDGSRYMERIDVNLVELPVSAVDAAGSPVVGLTKDDFVVKEEGKPQEIAEFAFATDLPLTVGVIVDHSGSMKPRIDAARTAAVSFFEQILGTRDRAFFGGFAWDARAISPLVGDVAVLRSLIDQMPEAEGGTALYDAVITALYRFRGIEGRKALIVVTDGEDTASKVAGDAMLRYVRASRVPLYFIGIGISAIDFTTTSALRNLAAETGGRAFFIRNTDQLPATYAQLEQELRTQYLLRYYTDASNDRYRTVDVSVSRPGVTVRTVRGFIP